MKRLLYILSAIFLLASCRQEEFPEGDDGYGYLSLKSVVTEVENVNRSASRAVPSFEAECLYVEVWEGEKKVLSYNPGENIPESVKLPVGNYIAKAYNEACITGQPLDNDAAGNPVFYGETQPFTITETQYPVSQTIDVSLRNFGISFSLDENFYAYFHAPKLEVTDGKRSVTVKESQLTSDTYVYFYVGEEMPTYTLTALNADNEEVNLEKTLNSAENGKCYTLTFTFNGMVTSAE